MFLQLIGVAELLAGNATNSSGCQVDRYVFPFDLNVVVCGSAYGGGHVKVR